MSYALTLADNVNHFVISGNGSNVVTFTLGSIICTVSGANLVNLVVADFFFV